MNNSQNVDIIIPCYNEDENVFSLVDSWKKILEKNKNFYIYFVDNGSTDKTNLNLKNAIGHEFIENMKIVNVENNIGYGNGIKSGIFASNNEIICWTHADLQIPANNVEKIIKEFLTYKDKRKAVFKGKRENRGMVDRFFTMMMTVIGFILSGQLVDDINAQPKVILRENIKNIKEFPDDFSIDAHLLYTAKFKKLKIVSLYSEFNERVKNEPKGGGSFKGKIILSINTLRYFLKLIFLNKRNL